MALDKNSYCPGGTEKKIKHCACQDMMGELEKIASAVEGDQRIAALERINRTLATKAHRPCLLAFKISILLEMKDLQALEDTVTTFVKVAPDNVLAHTFAAILESRKRRVREAVDELQTAMSLVKDLLPGELLDAFESVGALLATAGEYMAAHAHLMARLSMDAHNKEAARPLLGLLGAERIPLLLKRNITFAPCPAGATWKARFDSAYEEVVSSCWKKGLEKFEKLNQDFPHQPAILGNIALARSCLALPRQLEAWQAYARCPGAEFAQAAEAEALTQLMSWNDQMAMVPVVKWTIYVQDANALNEKLLSSQLFLPVKGDLSAFRTDDAPPPKSAFMVLNKPQPDEGAELTVDNAPQVVTYLALFGRETDRAARLEMKLTKTETLEQTRTSLAELAGELLSSEESEEMLGTVPRLQTALDARYTFRPEVPVPVRQRVTDELVQRRLMQQWPDIPLTVLDDKSPRQVMGDPAYRLQLAGALVALEQYADIQRWPVDVNALREQLGVPVPEPIDPQTTSVITLSPADLSRVVPEKLTDDELMQAYEQAIVSHGRQAILRLSEELLRRESLADHIDRAMLHATIAELTPDSNKALACLHEAQTIATAKKASPARYLLAELPLRLMRGESAEASSVLRQIETRHIREPGVAESLYHLLVQFGIISPDGRPGGAPPEAEQVAEPTPPSSTLWTPDAPPAATEEKKPSQLWVPD